jgi:hypothetical protein
MTYNDISCMFATTYPKYRLMKTAFFVIFLLWVCAGYAQDKKGYDRLYFSYTLQNYKDKESVKNDGAHPGRVLYPKNADCHYWGLQYERVTAYGLVYGGGLQYGRRNYVMSLAQEMRGFDPEYKYNDMDYRFSGGTVYSNIRFWGGRIFVGYKKSIRENWSVLTKLGLAEKLFISGFVANYPLEIEYTTVSERTKVVPAYLLTTMYGGQGPGRFKAPNALLSYECYLGVEHEYKMRYLKNLSIGIEGARGVQMWNHHDAGILYSSPTIDQLRARKETFIDRNISLGLRVAVGLWK